MSRRELRVVDPADPASFTGPWRNRLADAESPYLRQHGHNPVDWWPWCDAAFERAAALDRPVFLSIGYAACHWCHVMERESFADPEIAALLNGGFVCVKVDREEHPEVDALYMQALLELHGDAGWPASLWTTPDRVPFQGGTYFPPWFRWGTPAFRDVLRRTLDTWQGSRRSVEHATARLVGQLRPAPPGALPAAAQGLSAEAVDPALARLDEDWDPEHGGWGQGAKFPHSPRLELLLELGLAGRPALLDRLTRALDAMAAGGVHDALGGGFHRYAVDVDWRVPHFEKMLTDNAQLARVYVRAWRATGQQRWLTVAGSTLEWMLRELGRPDGALRASLDAEAAGREGEPYTWTPEQLAEALGRRRAGALAGALGVRETGDLDDGGSVLAGVEPGLLSALRGPLLAARARRPQPAVDDKRVVSWNALAASALAEAGRLAGHAPWVRAGARIGRLLLAARLSDGSLPRLVGGSASGVLEDQAATLEACLDLHLATGQAEWLAGAVELGQVILARFVGPGGLQHASTERRDLFLPRAPWEDGAEPSPLGLALLALQRLAALEAPGFDHELVPRLLAPAASALADHPHGLATVLRVLHRQARPPRTVVVGGEDPAALLAALRRHYLPGVEVALLGADALPPLGALAGKSAAGPPRAWLCEGAACGLPARDPAALEAWLAAQLLGAEKPSGMLST